MKQYQDDDEPITADWVFANFKSMGPQYSARQRIDAEAFVWQNRFERFTLFGAPIPQVKTRGQIRMLMWVLDGIDDLNKPANQCQCCGQRYPAKDFY